MTDAHDVHRSIGERLRAYWLAQKLVVPGGVSEARLREFEARHGLRLPPDLRDSFSAVDGLGRGHFDDDFISFWTLDELENVGDYFGSRAQSLNDPHAYFRFADHSIVLPSFAIRLTPHEKGENVVIAIRADWGSFDFAVVADSFGDFADRYLANDSSRLDLIASSIRPGDDLRHPLWDRNLDGDLGQ